MENHNPLVSVTVLTYNSSKFVLETLESIKEQTYENIELIVSDDCSHDNSVEICREWIEKNKERFVNTHLITSPVNTGIPANKNRALAVCKGEWVKGIAGDDILKTDCIENFILYIRNAGGIDFAAISSFQQRFFDTFDPANFSDIVPKKDDHVLYNKEASAYEQYNSLLRHEKYIPGPTMIVKTSVAKEIGYIEKYKLLEDYPFYLRLTQRGYKIHFMDKVTVYYRIHSKSVLRKDKEFLVPDLVLYWNSFFKDYVFPEVGFIRKCDILWMYFLAKSIKRLGNKGLFLRTLHRLLVKVRPKRVIGIKRRLSKLY